LPGGLLEDGIATLRETFEGHIFAGQASGGGAEKCQTRDEFQGVDCAAHQVLQGAASDELVAHGIGDLFVARSEKWITQIGASLG
jgi:hypothetical protein